MFYLLSTMANLKAEFYEQYDEEMKICLLESDLNVSKSHAYVESFDENVSYYVFVDLNELMIERNNFFYERNCYWTDRTNISTI